MEEYFLMHTRILPLSTLSLDHQIEIENILQYTGGFTLFPSTNVSKEEGITHIISDYSND